MKFISHEAVQQASKRRQVTRQSMVFLSLHQTSELHELRSVNALHSTEPSRRSCSSCTRQGGIRVLYMNPTIWGVIGPEFLSQVPTLGPKDPRTNSQCEAPHSILCD